MVFSFLGDIGGGELLLILVFVLIFFGANKIPELARGLGKGIREFKDATNEIRSEIERAGDVRPTPVQSAATNAPVAAPPVAALNETPVVPSSQPPTSHEVGA